jgi:hypothetical protein
MLLATVCRRRAEGGRLRLYWKTVAVSVHEASKLRDDPVVKAAYLGGGH